MSMMSCSTGGTQEPPVTSGPTSTAGRESVVVQNPENTSQPEWMKNLPAETRARATTRNGIPTVATTPQGTAPTTTPTPSAPKVLAHVPKVTYSSASNVGGQFVAMTFDDGPHKTNTPRLLDMLKARGIRATFFVVGQNAEMYPQLIARMIAEGHEVANHTWSHPWLTKISDSSIRSQLRRTEASIVKAGGRKPRVIRPPFGAISSRQKKWIHDEFGYKVIMWSVDPQDWKRPGVSVVTRRLVSGARSGSILLAHDIHGPTIDAMPGTLDQLRAKGFKFVTVSELIAKDRDAVPATAMR